MGLAWEAVKVLQFTTSGQHGIKSVPRAHRAGRVRPAIARNPSSHSRTHDCRPVRFAFRAPRGTRRDGGMGLAAAHAPRGSARRTGERGRTDGERELRRTARRPRGVASRTPTFRMQMSETQRELAALSYSISHDLRAPLRSVDGFSQALAEDYGHCLNATAHDYLRRVRANAQHMSDLIDQLLALARIVRATLQPGTGGPERAGEGNGGRTLGGGPARRVEWDIQPGVVARGRPRAARHGVAPPARQRLEIHLPPPRGAHRLYALPSAPGAGPARGGHGLRGARRRRGLRHAVRGQTLRRVPADAPAGGVSRPRHRAGGGAAHRPAARRQRLGGRRAGTGRGVFLHARRRDCRPARSGGPPRFAPHRARHRIRRVPQLQPKTTAV